MAIRTRIEMRLTAQQKDRLEAAAAIKGQDLTSFALGVLLDEADGVISRHHTETVSRRDMRALLHALEHPRRPNAALRAAFRRLKDFRE